MGEAMGSGRHGPWTLLGALALLATVALVLLSDPGNRSLVGRAGDAARTEPTNVASLDLAITQVARRDAVTPEVAPEPVKDGSPEPLSGHELVVHLVEGNGAAIESLEAPFSLLSAHPRREAPCRAGTVTFANLPPEVYELSYEGADWMLVEDPRIEIPADQTSIEITRVLVRTWTMEVVVENAERARIGPGPLDVIVAGYAPDPPTGIARWITRAGLTNATPTRSVYQLHVRSPVKAFELCVSREGQVFHRETVRWPTDRVVVKLIGPLTRPMGSVSFRLVDADGAVPTDFALSLTDKAHADLFTAGPTFDGRYRYEVKPGVEYRLKVRSARFASLTRTFVLESGERRDLGTLTLQRPGGLHGELRGPASELAGRVVRLTALDWQTAEQVLYTNAEGRFAYPDIAPGRYVASVAHLGYQALPDSSGSAWMASRPVPFVVEAHVESRVVLLLEPSPRLSIRAYLTPDVDACIRIWDVDGLPVAVGTSGQDGEMVRRLPVGTYRVRAEAREIVHEVEVVLLEDVLLMIPP
jgi:hypothetical protein